MSSAEGPATVSSFSHKRYLAVAVLLCLTCKRYQCVPACVCFCLQLLVVSVTGTPNRPDGVGFAEDFVQAALLAKQAGQYRLWCSAWLDVHTQCIIHCSFVQIAGCQDILPACCALRVCHLAAECVAVLCMAF